MHICIMWLTSCGFFVKVGPGEVDDDLEGEVAEECSKFGKVTRVLIFEIDRKSVV